MSARIDSLEPAVRAAVTPRTSSPRASLQPGETVTSELRVTESRTVDYINGDSYIVPVGAMIDVDALEEQIATSRIYGPGALARDVDEAAQAALAPHLAWNEISIPVELALTLVAPALIDSRLTLALTLASVAEPEVVFDAVVSDSAGNVVAAAHHVRRVCDGRATQRDLAALRSAAARD